MSPDPGPSGPPPGPPGPPPPAGGAVDDGPVDPDSPKGRYLASLPSDAPASSARGWRSGATGDWSFYFVAGAPGQKLHAAGVAPDGTIVRPGADAGWPALLSSADPEEVQRRVAWLHGAWIALAPGSPASNGPLKKHPALADHLQPPSVTQSGETTTFTAWYAEPPAMMSFRLTVTAGPQGTTFERTRLADLTP